MINALSSYFGFCHIQIRNLLLGLVLVEFVLYVHMALNVIRQLCEILKIDVFKIKNEKK